MSRASTGRRSASRISRAWTSAAGTVANGVLTVSVTGAEGSPLALYLDAGKVDVTPEDPGFDAEPLETGLVRVAGRVPEGKTVRLKLS